MKRDAGIHLQGKPSGNRIGSTWMIGMALQYSLDGKGQAFDRSISRYRLIGILGTIG